jgi:hypothetical protein
VASYFDRKIGHAPYSTLQWRDHHSRMRAICKQSGEKAPTQGRG